MRIIIHDSPDNARLIYSYRLRMQQIIKTAQKAQKERDTAQNDFERVRTMLAELGNHEFGDFRDYIA